MIGSIPKIVFIINGHDASLIRWSVGYLSEALHRAGVDSSVIDLQEKREKECDDADVIVVYRCFDTRTMLLMKDMKARGKFVMYFLDDYIFQSNCRYYKESHIPTVDYLNLADCLVASSPILLSKMPDKLKIFKRSVLDHEAVGVLSQEYRRDKSVFSIGWLAGRGRGDFMDDFIVEFLCQLDKKIQGERCIFKCFGHYGLPKFKNFLVKSYPYVTPANWKALYGRFVDMDLGVSINVLDEADDFCKCKSELKLVETGALGVPLITSRVPPFVDIIREGETGFFASTPLEFVEKVLLAMKNEVLARHVSENVKVLIRDNYDVDKNSNKFLEDVVEKRNEWMQRKQQ